MAGSVFNVASLRSEIDVGPSAYFPSSFARQSGVAGSTAAQSFQWRDAMASIGEHEEWQVTGTEDLNHTLRTVRHLRAKSMGRIVHSLKRAQHVYVAFVMDTTGSMGEHLDMVKAQIAAIATALELVGLELLVGFVGYKDHGDADSIQVLPFTSNVGKFQRFVEAIDANGGDDAPEDVLGGLWAAATQLPWEPECTNVLFHIGDAPPHGTTYWTGYDNFPSGHPLDQSPGAIFGQLLALNVAYYFGKLTTWTDMMVQVFRRHAAITVFDVGDSIDLYGSVITATQESVVYHQQRVLGSVGSGQTFDLRVPTWSGIKRRQAELARYRCNPATLSAEDVTAPMTMLIRKSTVRIAPLPFARGCERSAFYAQEMVSDPNAPSKCSWQRMVAKRFLRNESKSANGVEGRYLKAMEGQAMAAALAQNFNKLMATGPLAAVSLSFLEASVAKLADGDEFVAMERFLPSFERFSNNVDWVSPREATDPCVQYAVAFTHWTWVATKGYLMVVDLQGHRANNDTMVLTDPAIHCTDMVRFAGGTNLGARGMDEFFATHTCNHFCDGFQSLMAGQSTTRKRSM
ncbi:hypothetical protein H310_04210 [Aphanomyces invadans]|uniref:Alpha-type protein kinase domain-containing protein n=1 Tax=Aphanomyces invadans TaxID=157072 RepID=A0A024UGA0_9STRA|nr:hypothetical protein H310_04210 [Aphanomyces invadans]ETW05240.1 hypothetical protein H310_04210 [Aphanomyces invadans]|eukprot:XP_008866678.1 hypothetical protein H310_04210 [Aphanomyces invadans]